MTIIEKVTEMDQLRQIALSHSQVELAELIETYLTPITIALVEAVKNGTFENSAFLLEFADKASDLAYRISQLAEERGIAFYVLDLDQLREFAQRNASAVTHAEAAFNLVGYKILMLYFELLGDTAHLKLGSDRFESSAFKRELDSEA